RPLTTRVEGAPASDVEVSAVVRAGTPAPVWNVPALREDLTKFAGMTLANMQIAEALARNGELVQKAQDQGALTKLERHLTFLLGTDPPGSIVTLEGYFDTSTQLRRFTTLAPDVARVRTLASVLKSEYETRKVAFFEKSDDQKFQEASHECQVHALNLVDGSKALQRRVFRLL